DERLERLSELRIRIEGSEEIASGDGLLASGLLEDTTLVEQDGLKAFVLLRRVLRAQTVDEAARAVRLCPRGLRCHVDRRASGGELLIMGTGEYRRAARGV